MNSGILAYLIIKFIITFIMLYLLIYIIEPTVIETDSIHDNLKILWTAIVITMILTFVSIILLKDLNKI